VRRALQLLASVIIRVKTFPSANPTPSRADIDMTREISCAPMALKIAAHDHLVIRRSNHASFRSLGLF
jgi:DNA repair protein RadC